MVIPDLNQSLMLSCIAPQVLDQSMKYSLQVNLLFEITVQYQEQIQF